MWTSINKKMMMFLLLMLSIGIVVGIVFLIMQDEATKEILFLNINNSLQEGKNINNILVHLFTICPIFILSLFIIGLPLVIFYLFYNGFAMGFIVTSLTNIFGIKGLLYGIIYAFITKGLFLILFLIFSITIFKLTRSIIENIFYKKRNKEIIIVLFKKCLLTIALIFILDIILYFGGKPFLNLFNFLIQ